MRNQDPLALAVFAAALVLLAGLLLYLVFGASRTPQGEPAPATKAGSLFFERLKAELRGMAEEIRRDLPFAGDARPETPRPREKGAKGDGGIPRVALRPGHSWRYAVEVSPPVWRDITLAYRTGVQSGALTVHTDFTHAAGKMNFNLGTFARGHSSHASTRFPGFFMHAAYLPEGLAPGQIVSWGWAWQPVREGRLKRYDGRALRWENVQVPAGTYRALVIDAQLSYLEGGQVRASAREMLWYAPAISQVVRVLREGRTPDEGLDRIVAELAEYR